MNETNWRYQLSAMWNHGNWAIEANANNLFMMKNNVVDELSVSYYSFKQIDQSRSYNQYANLKIVYSFDYGKKTSKSPDYKHQNSESAILKQEGKDIIKSLVTCSCEIQIKNCIQTVNYNYIFTHI